jgi:imidazole glycerol-phosphate synthase subunit HisH
LTRTKIEALTAENLNQSESTKVISIIDYGLGNHGSILNMFRRLAIPAKLASNSSEIESAERIILPGVGPFDGGMAGLKHRDLIHPLHEAALLRKIPILGICLGMQLLTNGSAEGSLPGLAWINATTVKWRFNPRTTGLKIPHMGWNTVITRNQWFAGSCYNSVPKFYFVHSYHAECESSDDVAATVFHGYEAVAAVQKENIAGVQFHPEKSHRFGMTLLKAFSEWVPVTN